MDPNDRRAELIARYAGRPAETRTDSASLLPFLAKVGAALAAGGVLLGFVLDDFWLRVISITLLVLTASWVSLWGHISARKLRKDEGKVQALVGQGEQAEAAGQMHEAIRCYRDALMACLGIGQGTLKLLPVGLCLEMRTHGWPIVDRLATACQKASVPFCTDELRRVVDDCRALSGDTAMVNEHNLPKGRGKQVYAGMRQALIDLCDAIAPTAGKSV